MPIDIQTDTTKNLTIYECIGHVEFIDIVEAMVKYYEGIGVVQTNKVIWDFSRQDTIHLTQYQTNKLADLNLMHSGKFEGVKTAILPPKIVNDELLGLLKSRVATPSRTLKVCHGKIEAMEWLGIKKGR